MNKFIEGVPVVAGTKAEDFAQNFSKYLKEKHLRGVNYRTGMQCGAWSLDIYLIPENEKKPYFQKKCNGIHIISRPYGYHCSGLNNEIIKEIQKYMKNNP